MKYNNKDGKTMFLFKPTNKQISHFYVTYTVKPSDIVKFESTDFMPVPLDWETGTDNASIRDNSVDGSIKIVTITNRGVGLGTANRTYTRVPIKGDGTGAECTIVINNDREVDSITSITADELAKIKEGDSGIHVLDVRKNSEFLSEHVLDAENAPLDYINESMMKVDKNKTYYVHCAGGYRSMIFVSTLKARGYENLIDVAGGFKAIKDSGKLAVSAYVCPSTLL